MPKRRFLLFFVLYLAFLFVPNFIGHFGRDGIDYFLPNQPWNAAELLKALNLLLLASSFSILLYLIFGTVKKKWLSAPLYFMLLFATVLEISYRGYFHAASDSSLWALLFETSANEKYSYLRADALWIVSILALIGWMAWRLARIGESSGFRLAANRGLVYLLVVFTLIIAGTSAISPFKLENKTEIRGGFSGSAEAMEFLSPLSFLVSWFKYSGEMEVAQALRQKRKQSTSTIQQESTQPPLVVVVIGESSSASHWQLDGYQRETTPLLAKVENLVFFKDAYSLASFTRASVPMIVRLFTSPDINYIFSDQTLISALSQLGYKTHWYSMQGAGGSLDDLVRAVSRDSDEEVFLNVGSYLTKDSYDQLLLDRLPDLKQLSGKNFFVLHTLGSHTPYHRRYPQQFSVFGPVLPQDEWGEMINMSADTKAKMINGYDNSVLYTDFILNSLIERLKDFSGPAVLAYVSDHGQGLSSEGCEHFGHDVACPNVFHVPMLFWANAPFLKDHAEIWQKLEANSQSTVSSLGFAMTVLELAGGDYPSRVNEYLLTNPAPPDLPILYLSNGHVENLRKELKSF